MHAGLLSYRSYMKRHSTRLEILVDKRFYIYLLKKHRNRIWIWLQLGFNKEYLLMIIANLWLQVSCRKRRKFKSRAIIWEMLETIKCSWNIFFSKRRAWQGKIAECLQWLILGTTLFNCSRTYSKIPRTVRRENIEHGEIFECYSRMWN